MADTDTAQTVAVVSGEESTATITNKELPGLRIIKYERGSMELMPGVSFEIFRDAESLGIYQTDQFGEILLTDCEPGTYRVEERNTGGDSHVLDTTPQEVELKAGDGIKELVFFNDRLPGIHLIKVDSADLSKPIANARFRIEAVDGSWGPEEYTTSEDGTIDLSKLPVGAYVVTELECPGYVVDDAQRIIHLDGGEQAQFVFTNSKLPSLHLYKESADGKPLGGVTYRLARIEDGSRYLDRTTGPDGSICWEGLEPGVYSLQEVSTVSDHILDPTEYHVELFPGKDATISLQNDKRPNLTIHKSDADTGAPVPGTVFLVKGADGHSVAEVTTGPDGSATVENLLPGVYGVSEKSVPSPYLPDADPQLVTLYPNRDRDVYFENHKRPTVTIQKENSVTHDPIQYAEFQITWSSNKTETGEQRDLGTLQTDEAGQIVLEGIEDGWLTIKETKAAPGYQLPDDPITEVYVKGGENKTVTISNIPLSALVVYKQDSVTGAGISGCRFQLKYLGGEVSGSGGTVIGTYTTSANGSFAVTGLRKGYYICEELESDSGHVIDAVPQSFYISGEDQDIVTLYFSNAPKGAVLVKKVSAADNTPALRCGVPGDEIGRLRGGRRQRQICDGLHRNFPGRRGGAWDYPGHQRNPRQAWLSAGRHPPDRPGQGGTDRHRGVPQPAYGKPHHPQAVQQGQDSAGGSAVQDHLCGRLLPAGRGRQAVRQWPVLDQCGGPDHPLRHYRHSSRDRGKEHPRIYHRPQHTEPDRGS